MPLILSGDTGISGVDGTAGTPSLQGTDSNTGVFYATDIVGIATNGTERMRIDSSGNVGIGTTSPNGIGKLAVKTSSTSEGSGLAVISSANDSFLTIYNSGSVHNIGATYSSTGSYQPIAFVTSGSERMRITSNGTVIVAATSSSFDTTYSVLQISSTGALANYAPTGDFNMTSGLYYASGEWKYTTTGLKGSRFQVASQGIQAIAGTNASPTAGGSVTQSTILYLTYNNTLALQDATQSAGTGIAFPATQNASSNANTLDDYEEGTWTPAFTNLTINSGTPTYSGTYTKIGRLVYVTWSMSGTKNVTITADSTRINNLPFDSGANGWGPWGTTGSLTTFYGSISSGVNLYFTNTLSSTTESLSGSIVYIV